jgi:hypothetical protein
MTNGDPLSLAGGDSAPAFSSDPSFLIMKIRPILQDEEPQPLSRPSPFDNPNKSLKFLLGSAENRLGWSVIGDRLGEWQEKASEPRNYPRGKRSAIHSKKILIVSGFTGAHPGPGGAVGRNLAHGSNSTAQTQ